MTEARLDAIAPAKVCLMANEATDEGKVRSFAMCLRDERSVAQTKAPAGSGSSLSGDAAAFRKSSVARVAESMAD